MSAKGAVKEGTKTAGISSASGKWKHCRTIPCANGPNLPAD